MMRSVAASFVAIALVALAPGRVTATIFPVTKTPDTNDGVCDADCSLREAIVAANANAGPDSVTVPAGVYTLTLAGSGEDAAAAGDLDITGDLTLSGAGAASTTIVGNGTDRVVDTDPLGAGASVMISGVTITNGRAVPVGGGVRNSGSLMIANSTITDNKAEATQPNEMSLGGGIGTTSGGVTTVSSCTITANMATGDGDAGTAVGGGIGTLLGETIVGSSTVSNNGTYATSLAGAGLGGGIGILSGDFSMSATTVSANDAIGFAAGGGGGLAVECQAFGPCGTISVRTSTIDQNEAFASIGNFASGGGLFFQGGSGLLTNSTVSNNSAGTGFAPSTPPGTPSPGSGLVLIGANATLANLTFVMGFGVSGLEIQAGATATFRNTIVSDSCSGAGTRVADAYNLEYPGNTCGFSGTDVVGVDPLLAPLQNNGGPTQTHALCAAAGDPHPGCTGTSPAIDSGNPAAPGSGGNACEAVDQRGVVRPQLASCDKGAYEAGEGIATPLEPFKCYRAKDLKMPRFDSTTVSLGDQFGVNDGTFEVMKPFLFCNPAGIDGQQVQNQAQHLVCYKIKGPKLAAADRPKVSATDQFGTVALEIKKPSVLCVPASMTILP